MSISGFRGLFRSGEKSFASSEINDPIHISNEIHTGISEAYRGASSDLMSQGTVNSRAVYPKSSSGYDNIRDNVRETLQAVGYGTGKALLEVLKVNHSLRGQMNQVSDELRKGLDTASDNAARSGHNALTQANAHTNAGVLAVQVALNASIRQAERNFGIINSSVKLGDQAAEGVKAVRDALHQTSQGAARSELTKMMADVKEIAKHGQEPQCVASRLARLSYLQGRNSAYALAHSVNVKQDLHEATAQLASFSVRLTQALADDIANSARHRDVMALQDATTSDVRQLANALTETNAYVRQVEGNFQENHRLLKAQFDGYTVKTDRHLDGHIGDQAEVLKVVESTINDLTVQTNGLEKRHNDVENRTAVVEYEQTAQRENDHQLRRMIAELFTQQDQTMRNHIAVVTTSLDAFAKRIENLEARFAKEGENQ